MMKKLIFLCNALLAANVVADDGGGAGVQDTLRSSGAFSAPAGQYLRSDDPRLSDRARKLIRIGEVAIAKRNDAELDAYFAPGFAFHGPGANATYKELKDAFAAYRASFTDFQVRRVTIVESGDIVAARTVMSGIFTQEYDSPVGPVAPTGQRVEWDLNNVFRYDSAGRLVEEWVQYDTVGLMRKLGVELKPSRSAR